MHDSEKFKVGTKVVILYERGNPKNLTDVNCRWVDVVLMTIMSLLSLAFGSLLYFCYEETSK